MIRLVLGVLRAWLHARAIERGIARGIIEAAGVAR